MPNKLPVRSHLSREEVVAAQSMIEYGLEIGSPKEISLPQPANTYAAAEKVLVAVGRNTIRLLDRVSSWSDLLTLQTLYRCQLEESYFPSTLFSQTNLEYRVAEVLLWLSVNERDPLHRLLETNLAIACVEHVKRVTQIKQKIESRSVFLRNHFTIMQEAFCSSVNGSTTGLEETLRKKKSCFGTIPNLLLVHDFDNCLTMSAADYSSEIPLYSLKDDLAEVMDRGSLARGRQRMSLLYGLLEHPELALLAREQVSKAVSRVRYFDDALETLRVGQHCGVSHMVLSANVALFVENAVKQLQLPEVQVVALKSNSFRGAEKPLMLLELAIDNPESIIVLSEDADWRLISAIGEGTLLPELTSPICLHDCVFVCARAKSDEDTQSYPFLDSMQHHNLPYGRNFREKKGLCNHGYQATVELLRTFLRWRATQS